MAERLKAFGYEAARNPLSGSSKQISEQIGRHDVRAFKLNVKAFLECKKTAKSQITLHKSWFDKLVGVEVKDKVLTVEPLVFAFQPDPGMPLHPVMCLPMEDYLQLIELAAAEVRRG